MILYKFNLLTLEKQAVVCEKRVFWTTILQWTFALTVMHWTSSFLRLFMMPSTMK